jgi:beta-glucosidase
MTGDEIARATIEPASGGAAGVRRLAASSGTVRLILPKRPAMRQPARADVWAELLFQHFDQNGDGVLNADEMTPTLRAQLERWDTNHDGLIDRAEFTNYFGQRLAAFAAIPASSDGTAADAFGTIELSLSPLPPVADGPALLGKASGSVPEWFRLLDPQGTGQISLSQWKESGRPVARFIQMDRNNDGLLTIPEVQAYQLKGGGYGPPASFGHGGKTVGAASAPLSAQTSAVHRLEQRVVAAAAGGVPPHPATMRSLVTAPMPAAPPPPAIPSATTASPISGAGMGGAVWARRQAQNLAELRGGHTNLLMLGDSITDWLANGAGQPVWQQYYMPLGALDFGISGLTTSQVLWQVQTGQVAAVSPDVVVLMIGTNNLWLGQGSADVVAGITDIVNELEQQLPQSRILLLGILPRGQTPAEPLRIPIAEVNSQLAQLTDGNQVRFLDLGNNFLEPDGTISRQVMADYLHPTLWGYEIYTASIWETLLEMLGGH